jgi:hypothetical protein
VIYKHLKAGLTKLTELIPGNNKITDKEILYQQEHIAGCFYFDVIL